MWWIVGRLVESSGGACGCVKPLLGLNFVALCRWANELLTNVFKSFIRCSEDRDARKKGC